jgi:hypothetical protein
MLLSGIIFYYLRTRISMLEQSVMDQAQLLQQVVTSLKSSQYRQLHVNGGDANMNMNMSSSRQTEVADSNATIIQKPMNLIQVSDDDSDESDDDTDDENTDTEDDSECESNDGDDVVEMNVCTIRDRDNHANSFSKIIDLSAITSSSNSFKPYLSSQSEIKVIELKSNIHSNHSGDGDGNDDVTNSSDDDDEEEENEEDQEDDEDDEYDEDDCSDDEATSDVNSDKQLKKDVMNGDRENVDVDNQNQNEHYDGTSNNNGNSVNGANNKRMKSIIIEDVTNSVSLDEMKNMPVNSLRSLAKTKLTNIDVPTINKMSKKEILKALYE